jgi:hypothetical protein
MVTSPLRAPMDHAVMGGAKADHVFDCVVSAVSSMNDVMLLNPFSFLALRTVVVNHDAAVFVAVVHSMLHCRFAFGVLGTLAPLSFFDGVMAINVFFEGFLYRTFLAH